MTAAFPSIIQGPKTIQQLLANTRLGTDVMEIPLSVKFLRYPGGAWLDACMAGKI